MSRYRHYRKSDRRAFSLIETIVVVVVLLVIASLIVGTIQRSARTAENLNCITNLRTVGKAMQLYIADMGQNIVTRRGGTSSRAGGDMWAAELSGRGYLYEPAREDKHRTYTWRDQQVTSCPVGKLPANLGDQNWVWYTYGLNLFTPGSKNVIVEGTDLNVRNVTNLDPVTFPMLADSVSGQGGVQTFRIRSSGADAIELRHNGKGNVLFLDGHVESVDRKRAEDLGFPAIYEP